MGESGIILDLNVDCCEFDPINGNLFCGAYELNEDTQERDGSVFCFNYVENGGNGMINEASKRSMRTSGVFGMDLVNSELICTAESDGCVKLFNCGPGEDDLQKSAQLKVTEKFCLSVSSNETHLVASSSCGELMVLKAGESELTKVAEAPEAHRMEYMDAGVEIWNVHWSPCDTNVFASGGEDQRIKLWDSRDLSTPSHVIKRPFEAGICSVRFNPHNANVLLSGCYDGRIRAFDLRNLKTPLVSVNAHAGPWCLRLHPERREVLGVACMRSGFLLLDLGEMMKSDGSEIDLMTGPEDLILHHAPQDSFGDFEPLAYGLSFLPDDVDGRMVFAGASFYDKRLSFHRSEGGIWTA